MFVIDKIENTRYNQGMEPKDEYEIELGKAIRQARIRAGFALEDVAARANLSPTSVRALELGRGSTVATLVKVLRVLGETRLITDWAAAGRVFSPITVLRETSGKYTVAKRASRPRRKGGGERER
ncbi:MAG: helix-turn-helix domain-containing protein [Clostridiales Family XIII bacterium]|jgi:transcriptional regulator with XRE-family HTH domain|nr:helix-turn-helix domain-containing protein [Clostridiales Family XIII bacterium]